MQKQDLCFIQGVYLLLVLFLGGGCLGSVLLLQEPSHKCHSPGVVTVVHSGCRFKDVRRNLQKDIGESPLCPGQSQEYSMTME